MGQSSGSSQAHNKLMALFHFKQGMLHRQEMKQVEMERECMLNIRQDIFVKDMNNNKCKNGQKNVMLGGINLGDIMRQTVMEEMRMIRLEDQLHSQRMSGS